MRDNTEHQVRLLATPWEGVHGTLIDSSRQFGRHWHASYGLGLIEHGAHHSASDRGPVDAYAGDLITSNPGEVHDGRPLGAPARRWRMIYLDPAAMASMPDDPLARDPGALRVTHPVIRDAALAAALRHLFDRLDGWQEQQQAAAPPPDLALACEEALVATCALLLRGHSTALPTAPVDADMRRVRERLADTLLQPAPSLSDLARLAGLSKYQVLRRFARSYGLTPHEWLLQLRTERARELIRRGSTLADAAAAAGFADQSHMTRVFVQHAGYTPGAWQRGVGCGVGHGTGRGSSGER